MALTPEETAQAIELLKRADTPTELVRLALGASACNLVLRFDRANDTRIVTVLDIDGGKIG